jgi:hypothetical protein
MPQYLIEHLAPGWRVHHLQEFPEGLHYTYGLPLEWSIFDGGAVRVWHIGMTGRPAPQTDIHATIDALRAQRGLPARMRPPIAAELIRVVEIIADSRPEIADRFLPDEVQRLMNVWPGRAPGVCRVIADEWGEPPGHE